MKTSEEGIALIKRFEQFRSCPYIDAVSVPTIGWGNTYYESGIRVKMSDSCISMARADELHDKILEKFEKVVIDLVKVELDQPQFDALVSLVYNIGGAAFSRSTMLKRINKNSYNSGIRREFQRWNKGRVNGELVPLRGLTRRRNDEANLYFKCKSK